MARRQFEEASFHGEGWIGANQQTLVRLLVDLFSRVGSEKAVTTIVQRRDCVILTATPKKPTGCSMALRIPRNVRRSSLTCGQMILIDFDLDVYGKRRENMPVFLRDCVLAIIAGDVEESITMHDGKFVSSDFRIGDFEFRRSSVPAKLKARKGGLASSKTVHYSSWL